MMIDYLETTYIDWMKFPTCSDSYNPVPGVMEGVPASRNYAGGFASKLMVGDLAYFSGTITIIEKEF